MQTPQQNPQTPAIVGFLPAIWTSLFQAVGWAAIFLIASQTLDLEFSSKEAPRAKEIRTKLHYKGNVFLDMSKPHDK